MESIADILKKTPFSGTTDQIAAIKAQLAADPFIRNWRKDYPFVDDQDVKLNLNRFYQYVVEQRNCSQCPGLELCPNDYQGHYSQLTAGQYQDETVIHEVKAPCAKFIAKQTQDALRTRIHSFYIDENALSHGYSSLEIMDKDEEREESVEQIFDYIMQTKTGGLQTSGLFLTGAFGTGKTFLMCYLLHELAKTGLTGAIIYMPDFSEDLKAMFVDPQKLKETIDLLKQTDLLILDDIGAENMNPWLRDHVLGTILNYRMNRKPTFFTSNYDLDALEQHFSFTSKEGEEQFKGQRIMDRIRPFVEVVHVRGHNKRGHV